MPKLIYNNNTLFRPNNSDAKRSLVSSSKLPYRPIDWTTVLPQSITSIQHLEGYIVCDTETSPCVIANEKDRYKRIRKEIRHIENHFKSHAALLKKNNKKTQKTLEIVRNKHHELIRIINDGGSDKS